MVWRAEGRDVVSVSTTQSRYWQQLSPETELLRLILRRTKKLLMSCLVSVSVTERINVFFANWRLCSDLSGT